MTKTQCKSRKTGPQDPYQDLKKTSGKAHDADLTEWAVLSNLRHELCTLLNTIIGYSEMLLEDARDAGTKIYLSGLEKALAAGNQLFVLVDEILQPAKIEVDRENLDLKAIGAKLRHKLNNPVNTIISSSEMLLVIAKKQGQDILISDLLKIHTAGQRILGLINKIVKHSKIQLGQMNKEILTHASSSVTWPLIQDAVSNICPPTVDSTSRKPSEHGYLLVVDDDETNRDLLARHLESQGHTVTQAKNGRQALEMTQKYSFDLVLLDVMMPEAWVRISLFIWPN